MDRRVVARAGEPRCTRTECAVCGDVRISDSRAWAREHAARTGHAVVATMEYPVTYEATGPREEAPTS